MNEGFITKLQSVWLNSCKDSKGHQWGKIYNNEQFFEAFIVFNKKEKQEKHFVLNFNLINCACLSSTTSKHRQEHQNEKQTIGFYT